MSGMASVLFTVWAVFFEPRNETLKSALWWLIVTGGISAFYQMWVKEHAALIQEQIRNAKPDIRLEIEETYINTIVSGEGEAANAHDLFITLKVGVWNASPVSTTITNYQLRVDRGGDERIADKTSLVDLVLKREEKQVTQWGYVSKREEVLIDLISLERFVIERMESKE